MRSDTRRLTVVLSSVALLMLPSCGSRRNLAERVMDDPAYSLANQRCGGSGEIVRPLIIEWPATDRASLEGRLRRGQVIVVRYEGCTLEVMRDCAAPRTRYDYIGITRKSDRIAIRTTDELYANMPMTAVRLEAKLAKAGELNVAMALVGNFEAERSRFDWSELVGRCDGATHVIAAAQVGAFEFFAGAGAGIGVGVEAEGVAGVGGRSTASREILNEDGDPAACERSSPSDRSPPPECGALLRLELTALDGMTTTCPPGSVWSGSACVAESRSRARASRDGRKSDARDRTPDDDEVCEHVMDLVVRELSDPSTKPSKDQLDELTSKCVADLGKERERLGAAEMDRQIRCVVATRSMDAMQRCDREEAVSEDGEFASERDVVDGHGAPRDDAICEHVMDIVKREIGDAAPQPSRDDIDKFMRKCVTDLDKEREKIGAKEYRKQARCVLAATSMEAMMRCEPDD